MGYDGPIDINHQAIYGAMDLYRIKDRKECFEKILIMSKYWISKMREK